MVFQTWDQSRTCRILQYLHAVNNNKERIECAKGLNNNYITSDRFSFQYKKLCCPILGDMKQKKKTWCKTSWQGWQITTVIRFGIKQNFCIVSISDKSLLWEHYIVDIFSISPSPEQMTKHWHLLCNLLIEEIWL